MAILGWVPITPPPHPKHLADRLVPHGPYWELGYWDLAIVCILYLVSWNLAFWPAEGLRLTARQTSPSQIAPIQLRLDYPKMPLFLEAKNG